METTIYIAYSGVYGILGGYSTELKAAAECARCHRAHTGHELDEKSCEQLIQRKEVKTGVDYLCIEVHTLDADSSVL